MAIRAVKHQSSPGMVWSHEATKACCMVTNTAANTSTRAAGKTARFSAISNETTGYFGMKFFVGLE